MTLEMIDMLLFLHRASTNFPQKDSSYTILQKKIFLLIMDINSIKNSISLMIYKNIQFPSVEKCINK